MTWLLDLSGSSVYLSGSSSRKNGFDHDSRASASYDAKPKPFAVIGQLYQLHMTPLTCWKLEE